MYNNRHRDGSASFGPLLSRRPASMMITIIMIMIVIIIVIIMIMQAPGLPDPGPKRKSKGPRIPYILTYFAPGAHMLPHFAIVCHMLPTFPRESSLGAIVALLRRPHPVYTESGPHLEAVNGSLPGVHGRFSKVYVST